MKILFAVIYILFGFIVLGAYAASDDEQPDGFDLIIVVVWPILIALMLGDWLARKVPRTG